MDSADTPEEQMKRTTVSTRMSGEHVGWEADHLRLVLYLPQVVSLIDVEELRSPVSDATAYSLANNVNDVVLSDDSELVQSRFTSSYE